MSAEWRPIIISKFYSPKNFHFKNMQTDLVYEAGDVSYTVLFLLPENMLV
jgi:hypothetical protein